MKKYSGTARFAFFLLAVTLTVYGIIVTRDLLYPITFGILLSYLLFPITNFMEKHKIPRILSILISIIIAISVFAGFFIFVSNQVESLIVDLPHLKNKALSNIRNIENTINNLLESTAFEIEDFFRPKVNDLFEHGGEMFNTVFSATTGTLVKIGLMPVYVF